MDRGQPVCGRFAPSPTGPLHFGSLVAALGSWLQARARGGRWLVRIEDLDPPRKVPGAADDILRTLEACGLHWDGPVLYQSRRTEAYHEALQRLRDAGLIYACTCSRRDIARATGSPPGEAVYPGTCRGRATPPPGRHALRIRVEGDIGFTDAVQGTIHQDLPHEVGDFVVRRVDEWVAYQLAVVVDDAAQGVTEVVRGWDLLACTPRQIYLHRQLALPVPGYAHLPLAVNADGEKLSKQTGAAALDLRRPGRALWAALAFLGQRPPPELRAADPPMLLDWGRRHWDLERVPPVPARPAAVA